MRACLPFLGLAVLGLGCSPDGESTDADLLQTHEWRKLDFQAAYWKHDDIYFIDRNTGWVVDNNRGEIHKTVDGGKKWVRQLKPPERPYFRCIGFVDADTGFACNLKSKHNNPLYRTLDGGSTWSVVELDPRVRGLCSIFILNAKTIVAAGRVSGPAYAVKSVDGGLTWSTMDVSHLLGQAIDIHFFNDREGILVGGTASAAGSSRLAVLATADGGESWTERYRGPRDGESGWKISFPSRDVGYVSIDSKGVADIDTEFFLKTEDGGATWARKPFFEGRYRAQGIGFVNEKTGWIGSFHDDRPSMVTTDGGESWREAEFGDRINRFRFLDGKTGFASGHWIYRFDLAAGQTAH